jgi:NADH-quinone oxidoreductase subunit M
MYLHQFRNCRSYLWFHSSFETKDLKITSLLFISPRWLIAAGTYTLTLMDYVVRFAQMIAHGFVVVGLFLSLKSFSEDMKRTIAEMGYSYTITNSLRCSYFSISISCFPTTFNFVGEFTVLYSFLKLMFGLPFRTTIILGAYYMLKMYQQVMLEKRIQKCLLM